MLEKLNDINWKELKHAYGSAEDVPNDISNLASQNDKTRAKALYNLYGNIFHQGTRYEATPYAIPFLYELIKSENVKGRHEIIVFLVNIALGYEQEYLPDGIDFKEYRDQLLESEANMTSKDKAECEKYGYSIHALLDCYDFVKNDIPVLYHCIDSSDKEMSSAATYVLSWFPEVAETSINKIRYKLKDLDDERLIANAVLAIGLLSRQSSKKIDISDVESYLDSNSKLVKVCAAIALAKNPIKEKVLEILIEGIKFSEDFNYVEGLHFNEGGLSGYVSLVLSRFGEAEKERILPALCDALKTVNSYQSLDVTQAIISILNKDRTTAIEGENVENLNPLEIEVLNSLLKYGGWTLGTGIFVDYCELLGSAGIPDTKEKLANFLSE